jgi:hypothetical protein
VLLFVTTKPERIDNIRAAVSDLPKNLHTYYNITTLAAAEKDFLGPIWKTRDEKDTLLHALVSDPWQSRGRQSCHTGGALRKMERFIFGLF